jgi:hypothetical protein
MQWLQVVFPRQITYFRLFHSLFTFHLFLLEKFPNFISQHLTADNYSDTQAHPNLTFMMRLTLEAYRLITDELWRSEHGFPTLKSMALVSRPLLYLFSAYLFQQVTITIRSEGWSTDTKD